MKEYLLWKDEKIQAKLRQYVPFRKTTDVAVVVLPGGGYSSLSAHEGEGYAQLLNTFGITAFVVEYRVSPHRFPEQLLDARRALRFVRANAEAFGINKNKVLVMGSSAGGHLAALVSTYRGDVGEDAKEAINRESYLPNAQILCYPVIASDEAVSHKGSYLNLLGDRYAEREKYSPELLVTRDTPPAFIWHTAADDVVPCENSYRYATALARAKVPCELHIFPEGQHGLGLAPDVPHAAQWARLLWAWLQAFIVE